jgi:hypothetical protein
MVDDGLNDAAATQKGRNIHADFEEVDEENFSTPLLSSAAYHHCAFCSPSPESSCLILFFSDIDSPSPFCLCGFFDPPFDLHPQPRQGISPMASILHCAIVNQPSKLFIIIIIIIIAVCSRSCFISVRKDVTAFSSSKSRISVPSRRVCWCFLR